MHTSTKHDSMLIKYFFEQEIEEQFGPNWETLSPKQFKLEARVGAPKMEKIEINFQKMQPECGWVLHLESENKVSKV